MAAFFVSFLKGHILKKRFLKVVLLLVFGNKKRFKEKLNFNLNLRNIER